ncbi:CS012 protein, partial [Motacilla alba]|nr:CS012 protein [Motacilla alba]
LGGTVGGLFAYLVSEDFKSVPQILKELPASEKKKLCAEVKAIVKNLRWRDSAQLIGLVMSNAALREKVFKVLTTYLTKKLKAKLKFSK